MEYKIPIKILLRYSLNFSILIMLTSLLSNLIMEWDLTKIIFRSITAFIHFYGCFLINLFLYVQFSKNQNKFSERKKFLAGVGLSIVFITFSHFVIQWLKEIGVVPMSVDDERFITLIESWKIVLFFPFVSIVVFTIVHFFHRFVILGYTTKQSELEVFRLQAVNAETNNQLLKQQIQPHFLFNALNTLKLLIKKKPEIAENYIIQLSEFLRASINSHKTDVVLVEEELKLCENYMEMQKIRFADALIYNIDVDENVAKKFSIPFFSLQPLLENVLKHNELTKEFPLYIDVFVDNDMIIVRNNLRLKKNVDSSTGNGLYNLNERYRILFQEDIVVEQTNESFIVKLKMFA